METKYSEVKIDHIDDNGVAHIDAFLTDDENENGVVLGYIINGEVYWKDDDARIDPYVKSVVAQFKLDNEATNDVSHLWHTSDEMMDYTEVLEDKALAKIANKVYGFGFRGALRKLEDLGLVTMNDIDRTPEKRDRRK